VFHLALNIKAEVMQCVYSSGTGRPRPLAVQKVPKVSGQRGFFSSLLSTVARGNTPNPSPVTLPDEPTEIDPLTANETSILLSVFSADVDIRLDKQMITELHRSTKKNPPKQLKYELIYVGAAHIL
jgi:hypothetical protein